LILAVTLAAVFLAWLSPWIRERERIGFLSRFGWYVSTDARGQYLIRQFVGDRFSQRAVAVNLNDSRIDDEWLANLRGLEHIEVLLINSPNISNDGLRSLEDLTNLMSLHLCGTQVSNDGIERLRRELPTLKNVTLGS